LIACLKKHAIGPPLNIIDVKFVSNLLDPRRFFPKIIHRYYRSRARPTDKILHQHATIQSITRARIRIVNLIQPIQFIKIAPTKEDSEGRRIGTRARDFFYRQRTCDSPYCATPHRNLSLASIYPNNENNRSEDAFMQISSQ